MIDAPLFRDPVHDGATDPVLVPHPDGSWWLFYTQRRATAPGPGVAWVHGTDIGVAVSHDGGASFLYRGTLDLATGWGRDTFWAPEILWAAGEAHMFVSVITGVPVRWAGHDRRIVHYVSDDLVHWRHVGPVPLSSDRVIDACVAALPSHADGTTGGWRMWFKDEAHGSLTWAADSPDLHRWDVVGPVVTGRPHEGPKVFSLGGWHWMIVDEWRGQGVYRSTDLTTWERDGLILDRGGTRPDDGAIGLHADVVVGDGADGSGRGDSAHVVYFTHPGRTEEWQAGPDGPEMTPGPMETPADRRSSIQLALLRVVDDHLVCDRDEPVPPLPPAVV
ncbi:hypothetical protein [Actinotalea sp. K2]|uniref:hypothetical protein n=1 Tax=Actinotalea sp. K2 TaxID=2939438 RepID=UPI002017C5FE|nr:hypothetical protein [Actinotalea sp. K2]MCL3859451.1 hypothetical protein [Actinotalea sp. K2]